MQKTVKNVAQSWANQTVQQAQNRVSQLVIKPGNSSQFYNLKFKLSTLRNNDIRIGFSIPTITKNGERKPYGIYIHKGVGKGTKAGQQGNTDRIAKPWLMPIIDSQIEVLAEELSSRISDNIVKNIMVR